MSDKSEETQKQSKELKIDDDQEIEYEESHFFKKNLSPYVLYPALWVWLKSAQLFDTYNTTEKFKGDLIIDGLYLGSFEDAYKIKELKSLGVTHCLSVLYGMDPIYPKDFEYMMVPVLDVDLESIYDYFLPGMKFIEKALEKGKIFVHCRQGKSRSGSFVICWMMYKHNMTFKEALKYVKSKRPLVLPNMGFINQILKFEAYLKENKSK